MIEHACGIAEVLSQSRDQIKRLVEATQHLVGTAYLRTVLLLFRPPIEWIVRLLEVDTHQTVGAKTKAHQPEQPVCC
jgi:hypothetical protein